MKITKRLPLKNITNFHPEVKDRTEQTLERKSLVSNFTALEDGEAIGIISSPSVDQDGDIIDPLGIKTDIYNGTCQWNHSLDTLPLGTVTEFTINPDGVKGKFKFSKTYDFAVDVYNLVRENILKGISIGYIPLKVLKKGTSAFNEYAKARGWDITDCERIIAECLWIETSMCPIGCNSDALILASKSFTSNMTTKAFKLDIKACDDEVKKVEEEISKIENELDSSSSIELGVDTEENVAFAVNVLEEVKPVEVEQAEEPKPIVLKIIRKGRLPVTPEIKTKALKFLQGKSF